MATEYAIIPRDRAYWIALTNRDGSRRLVERFDREDMAVQRLHALQQRAENADRRDLERPQKRHL
jgi:hypothetical protein